MAWDFGTDPEFKQELHRIDDFVRPRDTAGRLRHRTSRPPLVRQMIAESWIDLDVEQ